MRRLLKLILLVALGLYLAYLLPRLQSDRPVAPVAAPITEYSVEESATLSGRPAEAVGERWIQLAVKTMGETRSGYCGPYRWLGDVEDVLFLAACNRLASDVDGLYRERLGLEPVGPPAETLFLFQELSEFRRFIDEDPWVGGLHAGYASAARGFLALYAGDQDREVVLKTLAHELTHLVQRRVFGADLPPWLSEGLADAIGDTASTSGFLPMASDPGDGVQSQRLRSARRQGKARSLEALVVLDRDGFDRDPVSFDYELSALLVRFMLSEPDLAPRFRAYLRQMSRGSSYDQQALEDALGQNWDVLEIRFWNWLRV